MHALTRPSRAFFPLPLRPAAYRLTVTAPAVIRRIRHHPSAHGIQIDIGRHRPCRHAAFHDHALVALLPQGAAALVRAIEPPGETLQQRLHELAQVVHPVGVALMNRHHTRLIARRPGLRRFP